MNGDDLTRTVQTKEPTIVDLHCILTLLPLYYNNNNINKTSFGSATVLFQTCSIDC